MTGPRTLPGLRPKVFQELEEGHMLETKVNIVPADRGWILEKIGLSLTERLDYVSIGDQPHLDSGRWNRASLHA